MSEYIFKMYLVYCKDVKHVIVLLVGCTCVRNICFRRGADLVRRPSLRGEQTRRERDRWVRQGPSLSLRNHVGRSNGDCVEPLRSGAGLILYAFNPLRTNVQTFL